MTNSISKSGVALATPRADELPQKDDASKGSLLARLRLSAEDLEALKRQGTVHIERRGNKRVGKLRFRRGGKQVVRYLGGEEATRKIRQELAQWQSAARKARQLRRLVKLAGATLKESKRTLTPHLARVGCHFHGLAIRRRKVAPVAAGRPTGAVDGGM